MKFVLLDHTHFKRKRSHKIERSLKCTEWKPAFKEFTSVLNNIADSKKDEVVSIFCEVKKVVIRYQDVYGHAKFFT